MSGSLIQIIVFFVITALIGLLTYIKCRGHGHSKASETKEYFLAGGGLTSVSYTHLTLPTIYSV